MTKEVVDTIVRAMRQGLYFDSAARVAGVPESSARDLRQRDHEFAMRVQQAEAHCQRRLWLRVQKASEKAWQAAAWCLERRWPELFAKREAPPAQQEQSEPDFRFE